MDGEQKRFPALLITAFVIGVMVLYPLSLGPIEWLGWHTTFPDWLWQAIDVVYAPLRFVLDNGPEPLRRIHRHYIEWWVPPRVWE